MKKILVSKRVKDLKKEKIAQKNFYKSKGVPYSLRVKNLMSGETEW